MILYNVLQTHSKKSLLKVFVNLTETPLGKVIAAADDDFLYMVSFEDSKNIEKYIQIVAQKMSCTFVQDKNKLLENFEAELDNYFKGNIKKFTVPLKTFGSDFQKEVWNQLLIMPYASTQSYGDLAKAMGRPASHSRAVGAACGANTHIIVIPCHRLVAANSKGGFTGGIDRKEWLLNHEKKYAYR